MLYFRRNVKHNRTLGLRTVNLSRTDGTVRGPSRGPPAVSRPCRTMNINGIIATKKKHKKHKKRRKYYPINNTTNGTY